MAPAERKAWPDPPRYWRNYTQESLQAHVDKKSKVDDEQLVLDADGLLGGGSDETRTTSNGVFLDPPREPADGFWKAFGFGYNVIDKPSIALPHLSEGVEGGVESLTAHLKQLSHSILFSYIDLLDAAASDPGAPPADAKERKFHPSQLAGDGGKEGYYLYAPNPVAALNSLQSHLSHLHLLLNAHRPHLARATLRLALRRQRDERRRALEDAQGVVATARKEVAAVWSGLAEWRSEEKGRTKKVLADARGIELVDGDAGA
ncbi:Mediator of RNA polymerase II transcription subunit 7 [Gonapodya sp. JEL0774]|nr:Mediator of RNA polymerase II transcription subunit 7 [Gonapodya sp. JEL0774]